MKVEKKTVYENMNKKYAANKNQSYLDSQLNYDLSTGDRRKMKSSNISNRPLDDSLHRQKGQPRIPQNIEESMLSEYASSVSDKKGDNSVTSPVKTREDGLEDYRLEQRFPDDGQGEITDDQLNSTIEDPLK